MTPDPKSFVRWATFTKVLAAFQKTAGITVQGGTIVYLPGQPRFVQLEKTPNARPFHATGTAGAIRLNRGFVSFAGRTFYFPPALYSGAAPGGVFLKLTTFYTVSKEGVGNWSIMPLATTPELVWRPIGTVGAYCTLSYVEDELDPFDFEVVVGGSETLYIPIAGFSAGRVVNFITQNLFLDPQAAYGLGGTMGGVIQYSDGWG
jgi:hypothetical protein